MAYTLFHCPQNHFCASVYRLSLPYLLNYTSKNSLNPIRPIDHNPKYYNAPSPSVKFNCLYVNQNCSVRNKTAKDSKRKKKSQIIRAATSTISTAHYRTIAIAWKFEPYWNFNSKTITSSYIENPS